MTLLGVSTSALADPDALDRLRHFEPDVVEFYNYPSGALPAITDFCRRTGVRPALHTPVPYDGPQPLRRFAPTGPEPGDAEEALRLVTETVRCAARIGAVHVVVHFPSPYPPFRPEGFAAARDGFLDSLAGLARTYGVPVLIENLSPNPLLRTPEQYRAALDGRPELGFCLDLGHAHLLGPPHGPVRFARHLGRSIRSMHVYNTTAERYPVHGHEPALPDQRPGDGYLDLPAVLPELLAQASPAVLVLEHGPRWDEETAARTGAWLRELLGDHDARARVGRGTASAHDQDLDRRGRQPWQ
ncbi:sugar phosphate isomerase/epimerase family protein [Streptomyces physcomitrii]|uniref:sugar phosphate isomerase/epimerase family protein n=1 Tax=Streptomyces physcomitrii TaxID=2724184 RepID=UPI00342F1351